MNQRLRGESVDLIVMDEYLTEDIPLDEMWEYYEDMSSPSYEEEEVKAKRCFDCGNAIYSNRADAKFCSQKCRAHNSAGVLAAARYLMQSLLGISPKTALQALKRATPLAWYTTLSNMLLNAEIERLQAESNGNLDSVIFNYDWRTPELPDKVWQGLEREFILDHVYGIQMIGVPWSRNDVFHPHGFILRGSHDPEYGIEREMVSEFVRRVAKLAKRCVIIDTGYPKTDHNRTAPELFKMIASMGKPVEFYYKTDDGKLSVDTVNLS